MLKVRRSPPEDLGGKRLRESPSEPRGTRPQTPSAGERQREEKRGGFTGGATLDSLESLCCFLPSRRSFDCLIKKLIDSRGFYWDLLWGFWSSRHAGEEVRATSAAFLLLL